MHCDPASLTAYIGAPSLTQPAHAPSPAERVRKVWSVEGGLGAGVVLGELLRAALSARAPSRQRIFSGPARFRQLGQPGGTVAAVEVSRAGKAQPGELGGFPS